MRAKGRHAGKTAFLSHFVCLLAREATVRGRWPPDAGHYGTPDKCLESCGARVSNGARFLRSNLLRGAPFGLRRICQSFTAIDAHMETPSVDAHAQAVIFHEIAQPHHRGT